MKRNRLGSPVVKGRFMIACLTAVLALTMPTMGAAPIADEAPTHAPEPEGPCLDVLAQQALFMPLACQGKHPVPWGGSLALDEGLDTPTSGHGSGMGPGCAVPSVDDKCEAWNENDHPYVEAGPSGDIVYARDGSSLAAVDAATGQTTWTTSTIAWDLAVSPDGSTLFGTDLDMGTGLAEVLALDAATGERVWTSASFEVMQDSTSANPEVAVGPDGETVFVSSTSRENPRTGYNTQVHAFDAGTAETLWRGVYNGPVDIGDFVEGLDVSPDGSQVFVSATTVTGPYGLTTYPREISVAAFDAETGDLDWSATYSKPSGETPVRDDPVVSSDGERVYVAGTQWTDYPHNRNPARDYVAVAYDTATGEELWDARYDGPPVGVYDSDDRVRAMTVGGGDDEQVYVTGFSGLITWSTRTVAFDGETGELQWVAEFDAGHRYDVPAEIEPAPDGGRVYVFGESTLESFSPASFVTLAYDADTGEQDWVARRGDNPTDDAATVETRTVLPLSLAVTGSGDHVVAGGFSVQQGLVSVDQTIFAYETGPPDLLPGDGAGLEGVNEG